MDNKIICLIDMDCFYVQVEQIAAPEFLNKPCGVCQYNPYKGGGLIAVSYEARKFNIKRGMRGDEAKKLCPQFHAFFVNNKRGKADISKYRDASLKIFEIISKHCESVEKASIDEAYLDLTDVVMNRLNQIKNIDFKDLKSSFVVGSYSMDTNSNDREENLKAWLEPILDLDKGESNDALLAIGALIVEELRADIKNTLGYNCSAGIANSKTLAKLCAGLNKPNKQTILPKSAIESLYDKTQLNQVRNLGGKLGSILNEELNLKTMSDLAQMNLNDLIKRFGDKTGNWLHQISHGIDHEPVMCRQAPKSIGCSKNFRGKQALNTVSKVTHWIKQLSEELQERLDSDKERNQREANLLVVHITTEAGTFSKSTSLTKYCSNRFQEQAIEILKTFNKGKNDSWQPAIVTLGLSASKFVENTQTSNPLLKYFNNAASTKSTKQNENEEESPECTEACTSSENLTESNNENNNLSDLIETMNAIDHSEPTTSAKSSKQNTNLDESNLDADSNFEENDDCVLINENNNNNNENNKQKKSETASANYFQSQVANIENLESTDYVQCEKCLKKILVWYFPEHEDFHYAQEISKQLSDSNKPSVTSDVNTKKRSLTETPTKVAESSKKILLPNANKGKKSKSDTNENKSNVKSIDNYFKKINK